jgi:hypothetical protein
MKRAKKKQEESTMLMAISWKNRVSETPSRCFRCSLLDATVIVLENEARLIEAAFLGAQQEPFLTNLSSSMRPRPISKKGILCSWPLRNGQCYARQTPLYIHDTARFRRANHAEDGKGARKRITYFCNPNKTIETDNSQLEMMDKKK